MSAEYQFLSTQIQANNYVKSIIQSDIASLLKLVHEKRRVIDELDNINKELNIKLNAISNENQWIVKYEY